MFSGFAAAGRRLRHPLFWLACGVLLIALHAPNRFDSDEGLILHGAWSLLNGRTPYTDFFEFVAPGSFYLVFAAWKIMGAEYWVANALAIAAILTGALGVYHTSRLLVSEQQAVSGRSALLSGPLMFCLLSGYWPAINHNTFNVAVSVWSSYFLVRGIQRRSWPDACIGGLLCGIALLFLQHRGAVFAAAVVMTYLAFFGRDRNPLWWKTAVAFVAGSSIPVLAMVAHWPGDLLFDSLIRFPAAQYVEINRIAPSLFLLVATFLVAAAWLLRGVRSHSMWLLMALQAALFMTALQRPDPSHITPTLFPLLSLVPMLISRAPGTSGSARYVLAWTAAGLVVLPAWIVVRAATSSPSAAWEPSQPVLQYVADHCTDSPYLYAGPFAPGIYHQTRKLNATRYSILLSRFNTESQFLEARTDLEQRRPDCAITNYGMVEKFSHSRRNPVDEFILENYEPAYHAGPVEVWKARIR